MIKIEFTKGKPALEFPEAETIREAVEKAVANGMNLRYADLSGADLSGADLSDMDLRGTDLRGTDLDYSCWPLWCGSLTAKIDKRLFCQLLYHTVRAGQSVVEDAEIRKFLELPEVINLANQFHRVKECGEIKGAGK